MQTLEQISKGDNTILVDNSFVGVSRNRIHRVTNFYLINPEDLNQELAERQLVLDYIQRYGLRTIPEIVQEQRAGLKKLKYKKSLFETTAWKKTCGLKNRGLKCRDIYSEIIREMQKTYEVLKSSEIRIEDPAYDEMVDLMLYMGDRLHFQKNQCSKRLKNRLNDLKLASAGIWLSITEQKPTAIITRDSDFIRILMMAIKIMGSDFFMPNNDFFRDSMINFPVVAYFSDDMDKYHSILDSSRLRFFKKFCYPGLDCYENGSINQRVGDFFRKVA